MTLCLYRIVSTLKPDFTYAYRFVYMLVNTQYLILLWPHLQKIVKQLYKIPFQKECDNVQAPLYSLHQGLHETSH